MIALTFVGVLLLGVVGVQAVLAPSLSDRWARRRLTARGATLSDEGAAALLGALNRRTRVACAGGAVAIVATLAMLWGVVREPTGSPDLALVGLVLAATVLGSALAEVVEIVRTTPPPPDGPRVASLQVREPHRTVREGRAEQALVAVAALVAAACGVSWAAGVTSGAAATACALTALTTIGACLLTRRWLLARPTPAGDTESAVVADTLADATADRLTENLTANGAVLLAYAGILLAPSAGVVGLVALGAAYVAVFAAVTVATGERRKALMAVQA